MHLHTNTHSHTHATQGVPRCVWVCSLNTTFPQFIDAGAHVSIWFFPTVSCSTMWIVPVYLFISPNVNIGFFLVWLQMVPTVVIPAHDFSRQMLVLPRMEFLSKCTHLFSFFRYCYQCYTTVVTIYTPAGLVWAFADDTFSPASSVTSHFSFSFLDVGGRLLGSHHSLGLHEERGWTHFHIRVGLLDKVFCWLIVQSLVHFFY